MLFFFYAVVQAAAAAVPRERPESKSIKSSTRGDTKCRAEKAKVIHSNKEESMKMRKIETPWNIEKVEHRWHNQHIRTETE